MGITSSSFDGSEMASSVVAGVCVQVSFRFSRSPASLRFHLLLIGLLGRLLSTPRDGFSQNSNVLFADIPLVSSS